MQGLQAMRDLARRRKGKEKVELAPRGPEDFIVHIFNDLVGKANCETKGVDTWEAPPGNLEIKWKGKEKGKGKEKAKEEVASIPDEFICPISKEIMIDPVVVSSGHTYERTFIEDQFSKGNRVCPQSKETLQETTLIPNYLVRQIISKWCADNNVKVTPSEGKGRTLVVTASDRKLLSALIEKLSRPCTTTSLEQHRLAARDFRLLTGRITSYRVLFGASTHEFDLILTPHVPTDDNVTDPEIQTLLLTSILNLSLDKNSTELMCSNPLIISLVIHSLDCGSDEAVRYAAGVVFNLSATKVTKRRIVETGVTRLLIRRLAESNNPRTWRDIVKAVFRFTTVKEFRERLVEEGLVGVIVTKLKRNVLVDELVCLLSAFVNDRSALEKLDELQAVVCLVEVINKCSMDQQVTIEYAVSIVCALAWVYENSTIDLMHKDEGAFGVIIVVSLTGTSRARWRADDILSKMKGGL